MSLELTVIAGTDGKLYASLVHRDKEDNLTGQGYLNKQFDKIIIDLFTEESRDFTQSQESKGSTT